MTDPTETVELRIRTQRGNLPRIMAAFRAGADCIPSGEYGSVLAQNVEDELDAVYAREEQVEDLRAWLHRDASACVPIVGVVLEETCEDLVDIPVTDRGADDA